MDVVGLAELFEHPQHDGRARRRSVIERERGHEASVTAMRIGGEFSMPAAAAATIYPLDKVNAS